MKSIQEDIKERLETISYNDLLPNFLASEDGEKYMTEGNLIIISDHLNETNEISIYVDADKCFKEFTEMWMRLDEHFEDDPNFEINFPTSFYTEYDEWDAGYVFETSYEGELHYTIIMVNPTYY